MKHLIGISALILLCGTDAVGQTQAPPAAPAAPPQTPPAAAAARTAPRRVPTGAATLAVQVTDKSGNGIGDVTVSVTGPVERSGTTGPDGNVTFRSVRAGTYRLRFEHDDFVLLEREMVMRAQPSDVSVALNPAPVVKDPVAPPPPQPAPAAVAERRSVEPRTLSLIDFVEKNLIGSEPQKRSLIACTDGGTARILQVREPLNNQNNADADQLLYVIAGGGVVRVRDQDHKASAGFFAVIPRGVPHSFRRDGRNPLIALTVAVGAACTDTSPLAR